MNKVFRCHCGYSGPYAVHRVGPLQDTPDWLDNQCPHYAVPVNQLEAADRALAYIAELRTEQPRWRALYETVNQMMAALGAYGEISRKDDRAQAVMDALHDLDGGTYMVPGRPTTGMELMALDPTRTKVNENEGGTIMGARLTPLNKQHDPEREARAAAVIGDERNGRKESEPSVPQGWRPIESAPRDGTRCLVVWHPPVNYKGPVVVEAGWICRTHHIQSSTHDCPNEADCKMAWDCYAGEFTHWMPLPPPPDAPDLGSSRSVDDQAISPECPTKEPK